MKKNILFLFFSATVLFFACSSGFTEKDLVGTWKYGNDPSAYKFNADKTFEMLFITDSVEISGKGTWSLEGGKLTLSLQDAEPQLYILTAKDNMIYLGDFEPEYKAALETLGDMTKEKYFKQFGYTKK